MMKKRSQLLIAAVMVAAGSSITTVMLDTLRATPATAQSSGSPTEGLILYAGPRRDTFKNESYIFFNPKTGDLWVYRNEKFEKHLRVTVMGEKMEKIKK